VARKKEPSFAEARARLDEILDEVESDTGDVDQLAARVKEASELIRFCRDRLADARLQVTQVVAELSAVEESVARQTAADDDDEGDDEDETGDDDEELASEADDDSAVGKLPF
jgi:exodeoxyribonuclease VII small subunit